MIQLIKKGPYLITLFLTIFQYAIAQETVYRGKIIRGGAHCPVLIKINHASNDIISHRIIMPSGELPKDWHYGQKISFTMIPLRQPVPGQCKAQVVASIQLKNQNLNNTKHGKALK